MTVRHTITALSLVALLAHPALAQGDQEITPDAYSKVSEQQLMLEGAVQSDLPDNLYQALFSQAGFSRFNTSLTTGDANDPSVVAWCRAAVKDTQVRRDVVDDQTGDALVTLPAMIERCSQVFKYDLTVSHRCATKVNKAKKKFITCTVKAKTTIYKYKASKATGELTYDADTGFGKGGQVTKSAQFAGSSVVVKGNTTRARKSALAEGATWAGRFLSRELKDIKEFQLSTPIEGVRGGSVFGCLGKDTTELDTPFHVVINTAKGEEKMGFVKARKIYDGCTLTPGQELAASEGKTFVTKPMEAQLILGSPKAGMTLWEMPVMHLNLGAGLGSWAGVAGDTGGGLNLHAEYNAGRLIGQSETYSFFQLDLGGVASENLLKSFNSAYPLLDTSDVGEGATMFRASVGVFKRMYFRALFVELGLAFNYSHYILDSYTTDFDDEVVLGNYAIGADGLAAVGWQLSPRWLVRLRAGFHFGIATPAATVNDEVIEPFEDATIDPEKGPSFNLGILYSI